MQRILTACLMVAALAAPLLTIPGTASAQVYVNVSVGYAPPPLPWYPQPLCPGAGYIWTPGYWAWGPYGYYWVPGTWVFAPAVGLFWTPGYWAWNGGYYWWHAGYWGPTVGFYGGIDYGYGYAGYGYLGGYWHGGEFYYNRTVTNVDITYIHNTYNQTIVNAGPPANRVSYNGGQGGIRLRATTAQLAYAREQHVSPTAMQMHQERLAQDDPAQRFTVNRGRPQIVATTRPGSFNGSGAVHLNGEGNGYDYHGRVEPLRQDQRNAAPIEPRPQMQTVKPYINEYRQPARPLLNNFRSPIREMQPMPPRRPTPAPAERTRTPQSQPPMEFGNPYAAAPRPSAGSQERDWNMNRGEIARADQLRSAPIRQTLRAEPHFQMRMPAARPDEHAHRKPGGHPG